MEDRDFWSKIADLQQQRGAIASSPAKLDLAQSEKEVDELTKNAATLEAAGIRGIPAGQRLQIQQAKNDAAILAKRQDQLQKMTDQARNDVKEQLKNFEGAQPEDVDAMTKFLLQDRVNRYNQQATPDSRLELPALTPDELERTAKLRTGLQKKGLDENRAKLRNQIVTKADQQLKMQYPAFDSLTPGEQESLRQDQIQKLLIENNKSQTGPKDDAYLPTEEFSPAQWDAIHSAQAQHQHMLSIGTPSKEEVASSHLPVDMAPTTYAGLSYKDRQKKMAMESGDSKKFMQTLQTAASDLASRKQTADEFLANYDNSSRTGWPLGNAPSWGSDQAATLDKLAASLNFTNIPAGQGSISDAERQTLAKANAGRTLTRQANVNVLNVYKDVAQRANEQLQFFENWENTFKTTDGAMAAWNEYISSPQGTVLHVDKKTGNIGINPRRMTWREYFDRKNKGDLPKGPVESYVRDPKTGKLVKQEE
jgi:hypothetical protein